MTPALPAAFQLSDAGTDPSALLNALSDLLETLIGSMPLAVMAVDAEGLVCLWSSSAERMLGWDRAEVLGKPLPIIPPGQQEEAAEVRRQAGTEPLQGVPLTRLHRSGARLSVRLWTSRIVSNSGRLLAMVGVMADETEQRTQERALREKTRSLELLQQATTAANESNAVEPALRRVLASICEHTGWPLGHALLVDAEANALRSSGLWHVRGADRYEPFRQETEGRVFGAGVGLPGRALAQQRSVWVLDLGAEVEMPRAEAALGCGLRSAFAFPVLVRRQVVGALEFFSAEAAEPAEALLEVMLHVGTQLGRVVERSWADRDRRLLSAQAVQVQAEAARAGRDRTLAPLSARQREVLRQVGLGADNLKIAAVLGITERTVKAHLTEVLRKLGLENRTQAARVAWQVGLGEGE